MCGLVAVYNHNRVPVNAEMLQNMTNMMAHRGPDDEGLQIDGHVCLGFRRLSILDLTKGAQPMVNNNRNICLVFNGEIYNYLELRSWLGEKGHEFRTDSDTEVLLRLYEETGQECVKHLRGMFGFVIWDSRFEELFAARDPFGIKPIYYCETPYGYMVASEIKSLLASGKVDREVDGQSFHDYLTFQYVPEPATMFRSIHKLMTGHTLTIKNGILTTRSYYEVKFIPEHTRSFDDMAEEARAVLENSVYLHRNSDVARGAFLSGGIDSSSLVGMLQQWEPTKTFSVGFESEGYSELALARKTASYLGTDHHEIMVNAHSYLGSLPKIIWHMDEPVADPSAAGIFFVSQLASRHVKVVFSGEGADEFFGGYNIYREPLSLRLFEQMPMGMRNLMGRVARFMPTGIKGKSYFERGSRPLQQRFYGNAKIFEEAEKGNVLNLPAHHAADFSVAQDITSPLYEKAKFYDDVSKMQYIDIHTWLRGNILMKADKMSMAHSLELRVPFVDPVVFQFASTLPTKFKVTHLGTTKRLLREAMKDFIPSEVKTRKKLGFPVPIRVWLKNEWYGWAREVLQASPDIPWINKTHALQLLSDHREGKVDASRKLWTILIFVLWHQMYIEQFSFSPSV